MDKYLQGNLSKEEKIIATAEFSKSKLIVSWIVFALFIIGCLTVREVGFIIAASAFFMVSLVFTYKFLFCKLAVTNKRVIGKIVDLTVTTMDAPLNKIQTVTVEKGILDGLFKCGRIRINTASGQFVFHSVCDPFGFKNTVMEQLDLYEKKEEEKRRKEIADAVSLNSAGKPVEASDPLSDNAECVYCNNCGMKNPPDSSFCKKCGSRL